MIKKADFEGLMKKYLNGDVEADKAFFAMIGALKNKQDEIIDLINKKVDKT